MKIKRRSFRHRLKHRISLFTFVACLVIGGAFWFVSLRQDATSALAPWNPGRIIDDQVFFDTSTFANVDEIQRFLDSKTPNCDTWGTGVSEYGGGTRAQYAASRGWPGPPYVCLQNYHENPTTHETSFEKGGGWFSGGISTAQIIWNISHEFKINPQVLLVMLKKEQGALYTDPWPTKSQYRYAMGYACPDTGPNNSANCSNQYNGLYNQLFMAAYQLRRYTDRPQDYRYKTGQSNFIQYSPDPNCGGSWVFIENQATANLYNYTPYQPNQGALNAYPGVAHCGAYGNRNFWRFFDEWFGSTLNSVRVESSLDIRTSATGQKLFTDMPVEASFVIKNNTNQRRNLGTMAIGVRNAEGKNYDFGSQKITLDPWQTYRFKAERKFDQEGDYSFFIINYREEFGWSENFPESASHHQRIVRSFVQQAPTVNSAITSSVDKLHQNQATEVKFTVKNNSTRPVDLGYFGLAMTDPGGRNVDLPFDTVRSLAPYAEHSYSKTFTPQKIGKYRGRISATLDGGKFWSETKYPLATELSNQNRVEFNVDKPSITLTEGLSAGDIDLRSGDVMTGTFKVKNFANSPAKDAAGKRLCYILRNDRGANYDLGCASLEALSANQEVAFRVSRSLPAGNYHAYFSTFDGKTWRDHQTPALEVGNETKELRFRVKDGLTLTQGVTIDATNPRSGDEVSFSFKLKNHAKVKAELKDRICLIMRNQAGANYDVGCLMPGVVEAGQEKVFHAARSLPAGNYHAYFSTFDGKTWRDHQTPALEVGNETKELRFRVKDGLTLTQGVTIDATNPRSGDEVSFSFKLKNHAKVKAELKDRICLIMRNQAGANYDVGCLTPGVIEAGQEKIFQSTKSLPAGNYHAYFSTFDGKTWRDHQTPALEVGNEAKELRFRVN